MVALAFDNIRIFALIWIIIDNKLWFSSSKWSSSWARTCDSKQWDIVVQPFGLFLDPILLQKEWSDLTMRFNQKIKESVKKLNLFIVKKVDYFNLAIFSFLISNRGHNEYRFWKLVVQALINAFNIYFFTFGFKRTPCWKWSIFVKMVHFQMSFKKILINFRSFYFLFDN